MEACPGPRNSGGIFYEEDIDLHQFLVSFCLQTVWHLLASISLACVLGTALEAMDPPSLWPASSARR